MVEGLRGTGEALGQAPNMHRGEGEAVQGFRCRRGSRLRQHSPEIVNEAESTR